MNTNSAAEIAALLRQTAAKQDEVAATVDGLVGLERCLMAKFPSELAKLLADLPRAS
jgi:hypothetical protein